MQACADKIIVKQIQREQTDNKKGLIIVPEGKNATEVFQVVSVGPLVKELVAGDKILVPYYDGFKFEHEDQEYRTIKIDGIAAKIS